jgi:hypothetical protein
VVKDNEEVRTFARFLSTFVQSLRRTIEVPFEAQLRQKNAAANLLREMLRDIESVRLSIAPIRMNSQGVSRQTAAPYLANLSSELARLCSNSDYGPILKSVRFRMLPDPLRREKQEEEVPRFAQGFNAFDAIQATLAKIDEFANPPGTSEIQRDFFELRSLLPAQKIAPAQFEIKDSRLVVRKSRSSSKADDQRGIQSARSELSRNGEKIIDELQRSNCDKRLLDNIQHLQSQLIDEIDAIKVGLTNMSCEFMCLAFEHELPSAISSLLKAHIRGVQLFIGQFPEWNRFLENAATAHLDSKDISDLHTTAERLVETLRSQPDVVDVEVPKTIALLSQLLASPASSSKRAAFAVLRSLENLISLIFEYGAEFGQKTVSKTIESASNTASKIIVVTLLTIALGSATAIGPIASKIPEMSWLQTASQIVKKQLEKLATE